MITQCHKISIHVSLICVLLVFVIRILFCFYNLGFPQSSQVILCPCDSHKCWSVWLNRLGIPHSNAWGFSTGRPFSSHRQCFRHAFSDLSNSSSTCSCLDSVSRTPAFLGRFLQETRLSCSDPQQQATMQDSPLCFGWFEGLVIEGCFNVMLSAHFFQASVIKCAWTFFEINAIRLKRLRDFSSILLQLVRVAKV